MGSVTFQDLTTIFGGRLEHISLFDVAHFALSKRLSGMLHVASGRGEGRLQFNQGQLLTVDDGGHGGDVDAAVRLFQWSEGAFHFSKEPVDPTGRIEMGTESFLLEVARLIDEEHRAEVESGADTTTEVETLLNKKPGAEFIKLLAQLEQARREELSKPRNEFEALLHKAVGARGSAVWLRVGSVPRTWRGSKPLALSKESLDAVTFEALARRVFGEPVPGQTEYERIYDAGALGLFHVVLQPGCPGPSILATRLSAAIPTFEQLGLWLEPMQALCAQRSGLILIAGMHGAGKSAVAAAMVDSINAGSARSIWLLESAPRYLHRDRKGVVHQQIMDLPADCGGHVPGMPMCGRSDVVVADPVEAPAIAHHLLSEAGNGRLAVGAVCAPSVEAALLAFIDGVAPNTAVALGRMREVMRGIIFLEPVSTTAASDADEQPACAARILGPDEIAWPAVEPPSPSA